MSVLNEVMRRKEHKRKDIKENGGKNSSRDEQDVSSG